MQRFKEETWQEEEKRAAAVAAREDAERRVAELEDAFNQKLEVAEAEAAAQSEAAGAAEASREEAEALMANTEAMGSGGGGGGQEPGEESDGEGSFAEMAGLLERESLIASDALDRAEGAEAELLQLRHQLVGSTTLFGRIQSNRTHRSTKAFVEMAGPAGAGEPHCQRHA